MSSRWGQAIASDDEPSQELQVLFALSEQIMRAKRSLANEMNDPRVTGTDQEALTKLYYDTKIVTLDRIRTELEGLYTVAFPHPY